MSEKHFGTTWGALLLLMGLVHSARASQGDNDPGFRSCVLGCNRTGCVRLSDMRPDGACDAYCPGVSPPSDLPTGFEAGILSATRWSCEDDCRYRCMRASVLQREARGLPVVKYFGKWPFARVLGCQELMSSALSLANGAAHVVGIARFQRKMGELKMLGGAYSYQYPYRPLDLGVRGYPYRHLWPVYALLNVVLWCSSAAFHARDTWATERADYLAGNAVVFYAMWVAIVRTSGWRQRTKWYAAGGLSGLLLALHWHHMLLVKFDYGRNMTVSLVVGGSQACLWLLWCARARPPFRRRLVGFWIGLHASMAFELLDFPPILGMVDAHAMWHAVTPPLVLLWYDFVVRDVGWVCKGGGWKDEDKSA